MLKKVPNKLRRRTPKKTSNELLLLLSNERTETLNKNKNENERFAHKKNVMNIELELGKRNISVPYWRP